LLGEAYGRAGQLARGLGLLDEALSSVQETGERRLEAELQRVRGELLLMHGDEAEAESCFQRALQVARRQSARSQELRAAMSLCRHWTRQGNAARAWELLRGVFNGFSEGFGCADLREARALLDELERNAA
jgi:predicted ATPase